MDIKFVAQPFEDGTDLRDFLHSVAIDPDLKTLRMIVAWAKRSGLGRAAPDLKVVRDRGGTVLAIVGVSEGGATEQGLQALLDQTDTAYVFHDRGRTFHPKVYLADGTDSALLLVGSHNLTAGGFAWNYEAGIWCRLDLNDDNDRQIHTAVVSYFNRLRADADVCLELTVDSLKKIMHDSTILIQNEDSRRSPMVNLPDRPEEADSSDAIEEGDAKPSFGISSEKKRKLPPLRSKLPHKSPPRRPVPVTGNVPGASPGLVIAKRWFKELEPTDAQNPPGASSSPTGNLRLSGADFAIDWKIYFFEVFFTALDWRPNARKPDVMQEVWVPIHVSVLGDYLGEVNLRVSHQPTRVSGQGNVPTVLHWGDLGARLRGNNYVGQVVSLERSQDDVFTLTIDGAATGPFLY